MKNSYSIQKILIRPWNLPLERPFVTALGLKTMSPNVLVAVRLSGGAEGYGEASSSLALPHQTQDKMIGSLERLARKLRGADARNFGPLIRAAWNWESSFPTAVSALECALLDALTRAWKIPLYQFFGGSQTELDTTFTISAWAPEVSGAVARSQTREGFELFKVKIGSGDFQEDLKRVKAVARAAPKAALLLDANQGFSGTRALAFLKACRKSGVKALAVEQPVSKHDWKTMSRLNRLSPVPVLADESVQSPADALRAVREKACSLINVKLAKSGVWGGLDICSIARAQGLKLMIGCMNESPVGLSFSVHLACGTGFFTFVDLDSDVLLKKTPVSGGFRRRGQEVSVRGMGPGTGIRLPKGFLR